MPEFFKRPFMGGVDRHGIIGKGPENLIEQEMKSVLKKAPGQFILGADCTVPGNTDWNNLKAAIAVAHNFAR